MPLSIGLYGGGISNDGPNYNYLINNLFGQIYMFENNWNYVANKTSFLLAYSVVKVGSNLYITSNTNFWKTDLQLNIINQLNVYSAVYSIYYNWAENLLYTTLIFQKLIRYYDLNLTLIGKFSLYPHIPWSINGYNNKLFVGTIHGNVLVIANKTICLIVVLDMFSEYRQYFSMDLEACQLDVIIRNFIFIIPLDCIRIRIYIIRRIYFFSI